MNKFFFLIFLSFLSACFTPHKQLPVYSRPIVQIGNHVIKSEKFRYYIQLELDKYPEGFLKIEKNKTLGEQSFLKGIIDKLIDNLSDKYLILTYGENNNISIPEKYFKDKLDKKMQMLSPKELESLLEEKGLTFELWKEIQEIDIKVGYILDLALSKKVKITLPVMRKYYSHNKNQFKVPEQVRVRQIVTNTLKKAKELKTRVDGGENFAKIAVNHSLSPDRSKGGDVGYFSKGSFPKVFDKVCFDMKKGEISDIIKSEYGYHIFKLIDKKPKRTKTFQEVFTYIHQVLFQEKLKENYDLFMKDLRKKVEIKVYEDNLNQMIL